MRQGSNRQFRNELDAGGSSSDLFTRSFLVLWQKTTKKPPIGAAKIKFCAKNVFFALIYAGVCNSWASARNATALPGVPSVTARLAASSKSGGKERNTSA